MKARPLLSFSAVLTLLIAGAATGSSANKGPSQMRRDTAESQKKAADMDTMARRYDQGLLLERNHHYSEAEKEFRAALALCLRLLGPDDSGTLRTRWHLAFVLCDLGKDVGAEKEYRAVLASLQTGSDPEGEHILSYRSHLAQTLRSQDKNAEAEREFRAVLAIRERVLGPENYKTVETRTDLASVLAFQGKHEEAEQELRAVQAICERTLSPEDHTTLQCRNDLAFVLRLEGKLAESERENRAVLAIREREAEKINPRILDFRPPVFQSCYNLALTLQKQRKLEEALSFAKRALAGWRETIGADHTYSKDAEKLCKEIEAEMAKEGGR